MRKKGFTLIELMLAMTFVAILIIAIAILVMNIQGIYRRGIAMREVNATSRSIIDDITRAIHSAPVVAEDSHHAVEFINSGRVEGGIFCTGFYSYIWRQADFLTNSPLTGSVRVNNSPDYRLLKMRDVGRRLCDRDLLTSSAGLTCNNASRLTCQVGGINNLAPAIFGFSNQVELISSGGMELALFSFDIFEPARSNITGHVFYAGSFILGTPRGARTDASGALFSTDACHPPVDTAVDKFDFQYCSINKFNFAASSLGAIEER
jgi:type II secretory pathway pseudopilin PulG